MFWAEGIADVPGEERGTEKRALYVELGAVGGCGVQHR